MMIIDEKKRVNLDSPHFAEMRTNLNRYITGALNSMEEKNMSSASIGLKIDLILVHKTIEDDNAPTGERDAVVPDITYKLALTMQAKADTKGNVVRTDHELVKGDDGNYYILTTEEANGQLNMFNGYDELPSDNDNQEDEDDE